MTCLQAKEPECCTRRGTVMFYRPAETCWCEERVPLHCPASVNDRSDEEEGGDRGSQERREKMREARRGKRKMIVFFFKIFTDL